MNATTLSPRRYEYAKRLIDHLKWNGCKIFVDESEYAEIEDTRALLPHHTDQAVDDLFELGLVDVHFAGDNLIVSLLSDNLNGALAHAVPKKNRVANTQIVGRA